MSPNFAFTATRTTLFFLLVGSTGFSAFAQTSTTGAIRGTLTDPSGAMIAGASVTVKQEATGTARTVTTSGNGEYNVGLLPPGTYTLSFTAPGFSTAVPQPVNVNVTETARVDASLTAGSQSETVEVSGAAPLVQTESATLGTTVSGKTIQEVPLTERNFTQVLTMSPGVVGDVNNAASLGKGTQDLYVNGSSDISNNFHMDGADINNYGSGRAGDFVQQAGIAIPNPDAIAEFKIQTTLYDAGFGRDAGANVDVITKSGSNGFHGALFEFFRNDVLNANDSFLKYSGQPRPAMKQNQFGGTLGGPVIKDRVFFFGTYQGTRQVNGLSASSLASNSLPALTNDRSRAALGARFCPAAGANPSAYGTKYGGEQVACDGSNINPVALRLLNTKIANGTYYIPTPQRYGIDSSGNPAGFSTYSVPAHFKEDQGMINTDYVLTQSQRLSERYFYSHDPQMQPFSTCAAGCTPGSGVDPVFINHVASLKLTTALTSSFLNEALVAYVRNTGTLRTEATLPSSALGITPSDPTYALFPLITVNGSFSLGGSNNDVSRSAVDTFEISDQISFTHGNQSIRAGFTGEKQQFNFDDPNNRRGSVTFQTFPDLLLGLTAAQNGSPYSNVYTSTSAQGTYYKAFRATELASFLQDDVKVAPNLTVNAGVRWEINSGVSEAAGHMSSIFPSIIASNPAPTAAGSYADFIVPSNYPFPVPSGVTKIGSKSLSKNDLPLHNVGPRLGFAWLPRGSDTTTAVRGGYGIFFTVPNGNSVLQILTGQPFVSTASLSGTSNTAATFAVPFTTPLTPGVWKPRTNTSQLSAVGIAENIDSPLTEQYNLDVQQQVGHHTVVEVGYVGTRGTRLSESRNINLPGLASPGGPINGITTNTIANAPGRVPYLGFGPTGLTRIETYGFSMYNSLQASVRRELSHGLMVQGSYTWGKAMTTVIGAGQTAVFAGGSGNSNNPDDRRQRYGPAAFDRPNRFVAVYTWQIPALRGDGALLRGITNNWELSGVTTVQSGTPLTFTDNRNGTIYSSSGTARAQFAPGKGKGDILAAAGSTRSRLRSYFKPSGGLFVAAPAIGNGTDFGDTAIGAVRGPGQHNWDMALSKTMHVRGLGKGSALDFRTEFFNAFNHPQYANPGTAVGTASFGIIQSASVAPRLIQFALKYTF
jgi:hypothetical protein